jgi:signal transduction histidine kinase
MTTRAQTDRASALLERLFPGEGEMATRARALDWGATALGPISEWPAALGVAASIALTSTLPMGVWWGPRASTICNDAMVALLGRGASAGLLGGPALELWPEAWGALAPLVAGVRETGIACTTGSVRVVSGRGVPDTATHATFSLGPLRGDAGEVAGVFCAGTESPLVPALVHEPAAQVIQRYESRLREMALEQTRAEQRERRRIATDLHDRIGQSLAVAQMKIAHVRAETAGDVRLALDAATRMLEDAIADTRTLIFEISPPILFDLGLPAALSWLAERLEERHGIQVEIHVPPAFPPLEDTDLASLVFRMVQELLMNVVKHAQVERAAVTLAHSAAELRVEVCDLGVGFDAPPVMANATGFGLFSVREQTLRVGGRFEVASAPSSGTSVRFAVPMASSEPRGGEHLENATEGGAA